MCKVIPLAIVYCCGRPLEGQTYEECLNQLDQKANEVLTGWIRPSNGEPYAVLINSKEDFKQCWPDNTHFYAVSGDRLQQLQRA